MTYGDPVDLEQVRADGHVLRKVGRDDTCVYKRSALSQQNRPEAYQGVARSK